MSEDQRPIDWSKTTFDGSRREQLRQARRMTVRQRLEALDELTEIAERLRAMPRQVDAPDAAAAAHESTFRPSHPQLDGEKRKDSQ